MMRGTIFAVSSGRPPAAIAVIRISGPNAVAAATKLAGTLPPPRYAALRWLRTDDKMLDQALVLFFPGPGSATGEDLVEFHCHGGRAVVAAVEHALSLSPDLRLAEPGEFTRRALIHGRIDLAEAQGLADLLAAETEAQRQAALGRAEGRLSRIVRAWLDRLSMLAAQAEASLDYAEEDDVGEGVATADLQNDMAVLARDIEDALVAPTVDRLRDGIRVTLAGPPNSGKSTLLNRLVEREAAIVSPVAGTTRDRIDIAVARHGLPYVFTDTAGLREAPGDAVEAIGIDRARSAMTESDLVLWLGDEAPPMAGAVWVHARADLPGREIRPPGRAVAVGADDLGCVEAVWVIVERRAKALVPRSDQLALDKRQREACYIAAARLSVGWSDLLIGAELLREATQSLARILGLNATEEMLDALFGRFCIGK